MASRKQQKKLWLEGQIKAIIDLIEPSKESPEFIRLSGELKTKLIRWDKESQDKKRKKFLRDLSDFGSHQVFKWQSLIATQADPPQSVSMDTSDLPLDESTQATQGPSRTWASVVESHVTPTRINTPKTRGQGPSKLGEKGRVKIGEGTPNLMLIIHNSLHLIIMTTPLGDQYPLGVVVSKEGEEVTLLVHLRCLRITITLPYRIIGRNPPLQIIF